MSSFTWDSKISVKLFTGIFLVFVGVVASLAFLAVRVGIYTSGEAGVLMAGLSAIISTGSFGLALMAVTASKDQQVIMNYSQTHTDRKVNKNHKQIK